jgi:hypothetical protein
MATVGMNNSRMALMRKFNWSRFARLLLKNSGGKNAQ